MLKGVPSFAEQESCEVPRISTISDMKFEIARAPFSCKNRFPGRSLFEEKEDEENQEEEVGPY